MHSNHKAYPLILEMKRVAESGGRNAEWLRQAYLTWYYEDKSILNNKAEGVDEQTKELFSRLVSYGNIYLSFDRLFFRFAFYLHAEADLPTPDEEFTHRHIRVKRGVMRPISHVFERLIRLLKGRRFSIQHHIQKAGPK